MNYETLLCILDGPVATLTLNRPHALNALNSQLFDDLETAFKGLASDPAIRVILLTGAGEKAFAAGADIKELTLADSTSGHVKARRGQAVMDLIETCGKPVIACINGFALGGGCELALACTLRLASESARLGQPEIKLGLIPGYGGTQRLPRLIGSAPALKLILTGEMISAAEALHLGLVDEVLPSDQLLPRANALAALIAGMAPLAIVASLEAVWRGSQVSLEEGLAIEAEIFGRLCGSEDKAEGTRAFVEKRQAIWKSR